ncbi:MAG TPA: flotillin-like protein FloA [Planctomycetota bacterium]|nr:flotillin-like protein FloA [Planctomycetota bacterium]
MPTQGEGMLTILIILVISLVFLLVIGSVLLNFGSMWIQAQLSGAPISIFDLVAMRLRKVDPAVITRARIMSKKAGIDLPSDKLEAHALAGGNVIAVVQALIAANKASITLSFDRACAIDLAGRDIRDAVNTSVNPKVIDCPNPAKGRQTIDAVAMNGIQLMVKAKVTVRTNIDRLVGGATEETIIARVGEGIVTAIGSTTSHQQVLENPDRISKTVLAKGLDAQTAFEIISIDIADVDVGENIGAKLRADQAEADKRMAQADAEKRAAMARAQEQEMKALVEENRAKVVLAEADVPRALAHALQSGRMGVMDYYNMKNVQADSYMREQIGGGKADNM